MKKVLILTLAILLLFLTCILLDNSGLLSNKEKKDTQMTLEDVTALAEKKINENSQEKMSIKEIKERSDGWIVYYDSKQAVETGDFKKYGVPGNIPLFIGKDGTTKYITNPNDSILSSNSAQSTQGVAKQWWFWLILIVVLILIIVSFLPLWNCHRGYSSGDYHCHSFWEGKHDH